ncbi:hypothetical protein HJD18_01005 [Thermoleophilia bacterium SCSIO 60948]|nr:hypothetical protein HJD18_01005 [Thermoleophilia bacterium SCSIO 60948]
MVDLRLYRFAFIPALLAAVVTLFSFQAAPEPIEALAPPADIAPSAALEFAAALPDDGGERVPGGDADREAAAAVAERFAAVDAGAAESQEVDAADGASSNEILILPGDSERTIVLLAPRNALAGESADQASQATGTLVEIADALAGGRREATFAIASTAGTAGDALGVEELLERLPGMPEAVVALSAPAAAEPRAPYVLSASDGRESPPAGLVATATAALEEQAGLETGSPGALESLTRLALPAASGPQAVLIGEGVEAVGMTSDGVPSAGGEPEPSSRTLGAVAESVIATVEALDESATPPPRGPGTYAVIQGDLIPGWTLSLLALCLILPAVVAALDATFRVRRRGYGAGAAMSWAATRTAPLLAGIAVAVACSLVGLLPPLKTPLPSLFGAGAGGIVALVLIVAAMVASAWAVSIHRVPTRVPREACVAGAGLACSLAALVLWFFNPFAALLSAAAPHVWLLLDGDARAGRRALVVAGVLAAAVPGLAALILASASPQFGGGSPWWALAAIGDGRLGLGVVLAAAFGLGAQLALIALALSDLRKGTRPGEASRGEWTDDGRPRGSSDDLNMASQSRLGGQTPEAT